MISGFPVYSIVTSFSVTSLSITTANFGLGVRVLESIPREVGVEIADVVVDNVVGKGVLGVIEVIGEVACVVVIIVVEVETVGVVFVVVIDATDLRMVVAFGVINNKGRDVTVINIDGF